MATVTRENVGLLNDKLTVQIIKDDYLPSFEKAIREYSKKASIPGFRKGMVPAGMVKKMYGASIFYDEVIKVVEKQIQAYLTEEKPDIFAQPLPMPNDLRHLDMNSPTDYEFPFEIGLKPEVSLDGLSTAPLTYNKVSITGQMIDDEIGKLQSRFGKLLEPEEITVPDNALNLHFTETDAGGNVVENGIDKSENSLLVQYFTPAAREQLMGKKKDDAIQVQLSTAFEDKEREWVLSDLGLSKDDPTSAEKYFKLTITKIGLVEKRELNEAFFNEAFPGAEIKDETAFRDKIKDQLQLQWAAQSDAQLHDQLYHYFLDFPIEFPDGFLKNGCSGVVKKKKTDTEVDADFPTFRNQLKWTLITDKIIRENKLEVTPEELRDNMKREILQYFGQMKMDGDTSWIESYIDRMMKDEKQVDSSYRRLITNKVFQWAQARVHPAEKEVTPEELAALQHHHH